ncbi:MAG: hypothetical protein ICCCNLDF_00112 [Planctomycetes bacterium]|nr:hypothetical protein [Planctomycetota bacterium]
MEPMPGTDAFCHLLEIVRARHYLEINRNLAASGLPGKFVAEQLGDAIAVSQGQNLRLMLLRPRDLEQLPAFEALAAERGLQPTIDLPPLRENELLLEALSARGYRMYRWHALCWADPRETPPGEEPAVEPVSDANWDEFLQTFMLGYGLEPHEIEEDRPLLDHRFRHGQWRLFLARVDGRPAAAGTLAYVDGHARLANACTIPAYRGRGLQGQLLRARMRQAAADGHGFVTSDTELDGVSLRNMLRNGLKLGCQISGWKRAAE